MISFRKNRHSRGKEPDCGAVAWKERFGFSAVLLVFLLAVSPALHGAGDSVIVTFVKAPMDIMNRTATGRFAFPESNRKYRRILMVYSIECSMKGCDYWDRVSAITVRRPPSGPGKTEEIVEIGRIITPPGRGGSWVIDVTDYRSLLRDSVTLSNYINTSIGGGRGYQVTIFFRFVAGESDLEAYKVENLWNGLPVYGDPDNPIEQFLRPIGMKADPEADFTEVKITAIGLGEGNTDGAARYSRKLHELSVADTTFRHYLWRDDCATLPGTPDEEEWKRPHAGFCLGDVVLPWTVDVSRYALPGALYTVDYSVEPYINECRPRSDSCPCDDCTYRVIGHSPPFYWIESQVVSYRIVDEATDDELKIERGETPGRVRLTLKIEKRQPIEIRVEDLSGREYYRRQAGGAPGSTFDLDLSTTPGIYLLRVITPERVLRRRLAIP